MQIKSTVLLEFVSILTFNCCCRRSEQVLVTTGEHGSTLTLLQGSESLIGAELFVFSITHLWLCHPAALVPLHLSALLKRIKVPFDTSLLADCRGFCDAPYISALFSDGRRCVYTSLLACARP